MDWYRKVSWNKNDEIDFFDRLNRAKDFNKAQYLKVQAITLISTEKEKFLIPAEKLLNIILNDFPDARLEISITLNSLGNIYKIRKDYLKALEYYHQSLIFENGYPNVKTNSYLEFSELSVKLNLYNNFNLAEELLNNEIPNSLFPIIKYKGYTILAIISSHKGNLENAKLFKILADQNADTQTNNLKYHKYLGIVKEKDSWLDKLIKNF